jgi:hypothetical protein
MGGMGAGTFSTIGKTSLRPPPCHMHVYVFMPIPCPCTSGNNPFDVVKTKMQASDARQKYANTLDCFIKVIWIWAYMCDMIAVPGRPGCSVNVFLFLP